jgi:hypothetical protein
MSLAKMNNSLKSSIETSTFCVADINDESMRSFFYTREITELSTQKVDVSIDDFNELFILANDMYVFNNSEGTMGYRNRTLSQQYPSCDNVLFLYPRIPSGGLIRRVLL